MQIRLLMAWLATVGLMSVLAGPAAGQVAPTAARMARARTVPAAAPMAVAGVSRRADVPMPWLQQDPGDSLYRAGRDALNAGNYGVAARQFRALRERYPRSGYAGDAHYWEAFARYRVGTRDELRTAVTLLEQQAERYPDARTARDARDLRVQLRGALARQGDAESAAQLAETVAPIAPRPAVAPTPGVAPAPAVAPAPPPRGARGSRDDRCRDEDDERMLALNALLQMRSEQALPILRQVLARRDEGSVCLRRKAVFLVSQHGATETVSLLLAAVRTDPDAEVREQAVFWLSQVDAPEAVAALDSVLRTSTDRALQEKAVFALSQQDSPAAGRALREFLERSDTPEELQSKVIFWLGQRGDAETSEYLRRHYGRATSAKIKERIIFSMAQDDRAETARWILGVAQNEREPVDLRKQALFWAGQMKAVSMTELGALYGRATSSEFKEQLIFVYSQRREPAALDKLLEIARTETNKDLRQKAIFWIGQSSDQRAAEFLLELINK